MLNVVPHVDNYSTSSFSIWVRILFVFNLKIFNNITFSFSDHTSQRLNVKNFLTYLCLFSSISFIKIHLDKIIRNGYWITHGRDKIHFWMGDLTKWSILKNTLWGFTDNQKELSYLSLSARCFLHPHKFLFMKHQTNAIILWQNHYTH